MKNLRVLINELENKIPKQEFINNAISKSSVGWHIEHAFLTINVIIDALHKSDTIHYKWKFNFTRSLVFTINQIPRGRVQSPKSVQPNENFTPDTLKKHFQVTKGKLEELQELHPNKYFEHPFFGKLNVKPTIKFLEIHTRHHIKIIRDIIGNSK